MERRGIPFFLTRSGGTAPSWLGSAGWARAEEGLSSEPVVRIMNIFPPSEVRHRECPEHRFRREGENPVSLVLVHFILEIVGQFLFGRQCFGRVEGLPFSLSFHDFFNQMADHQAFEGIGLLVRGHFFEKRLRFGGKVEAHRLEVVRSDQ